jgi:hypothetical protein
MITDQPLRGEYFAPSTSSLKIKMPSLSERTMFYVDGAPRAALLESGTLVINLEAGQHCWELTETLPLPVAPHIVRTENRAGGGTRLHRAHRLRDAIPD